MIPNLPAREIESSGVMASGTFGISLKDEAHVMSILRDTLYSDKVLAVLREYSSNAWDAHRMVGKADVPIKVILPTIQDPTLTIQDFGPGLSPEDVFQVYTQYGASTKRDNDLSVGMLGIGSKSGFSYSDSFTIISRHGGKKRIFVAILDESDKGKCDLMDEEDCGEETGITIKVPIQPDDIYEFADTARDLFKYFIPRPDINLALPPATDLMVLKHGALCEPGEGTDTNKGDWTAVMGCVPYRINLDQLTGPNLPDGGIPDFIENLGGVLFFGIGEVQINASREELKYSKATKTRLVKKINDLVDEFVQHTLTEITKSDLTIWEKRIRAQILNRLGLPIPDDCKDLVGTSVDLEKIPNMPFTITHRESMEEAHSIYVATDTRLVIRDDGRSIAGYGLRGHVYIVRPKPEVDPEVVQPSLEDFLDIAGLRGIPIVKISTLPWAPPIKQRSGKTANKKHKVSQFELLPDTRFTHPYSDAWKVVDRVPQIDDVYVILTNFRTRVRGIAALPKNDIYHVYKEDAEIAKMFDVEMPPVYGYKSTLKKPVLPEQCVGTSYFDWRPKLVEQILLMPKVKRWIEESSWTHIVRYGPDKKKCEIIKKALGDTHPFYLLIKTQHKKSLNFNKLGWTKKQNIENLAHRVYNKTNKSPAKVARAVILERYPLLGTTDDFYNVWKDHLREWLEYILIVDKAILINTQPTTDGTTVPNIFDDLFKDIEKEDDDDSEVSDDE